MMIRTKKELHFYLLADRMINRRSFRYTLRQRLINFFDPDYVMDYLIAMRRCQYYSHMGGVFHRLKFRYELAKFHRLSVKTGFDIGYNCLDYGVWLPHHGSIVIGEHNKLGRYTCLHTGVCITDTSKNIGEGCFFGTGSKIIGNINLGNHISVGANSVVNKSIQNDNVMIAGIPAEIKKECGAWYAPPFFSRLIDEVEKLKKNMEL